MKKTTSLIITTLLVFCIMVQSADPPQVISTQSTYIIQVPSVTIKAKSQQKVALLAKQTMKFVTAPKQGAGSLIANKNKIGLWETFNLIDLGNRNILFMLSGNGKFVCAQNNGNSPLVANRILYGSWETFTLYNVKGGVAFKSQNNLKYVTYGNTPLIAYKDKVGAYQTFIIVKYYEVALVAFANFKFVSAQGNEPLKASSSVVTTTQKFIFIYLGNNRFVLQSKANGKYVSASDSTNFILVANQEIITKKTIFILVRVEYGVGLKSEEGDKYVSAENYGYDPLVADRSGVDQWQTFRIVYI